MMATDKTLRQIFLDIVSTSPFGIRVTDKNRSRRQHLSLYEEVFAPHRYTATKMFEIGVNRGGSIDAWRQYFPNATIYGADIRNKALASIRRMDRVVAYNLDQSKIEELDKFAAEGPFDCGIDDGSHVWSHQNTTFERLWPAIKPGGVYVIEDTSTSYEEWLRSKGVKRPVKYADETLSCIEYFKKMIDHLNWNGYDYDAPDASEKETEFQRTIDYVAFRTNSIFIKKRLTDRDQELKIDAQPE